MSLQLILGGSGTGKSTHLRLWMRRFGNDLLNIQPKIRDKTFDIASESAHMTAVTARKKEDRTQLNDALLRYEQNLMRRQTIPQNHKMKPPVKRSEQSNG